MSEEEEYPATWEGGHALITEFGDEEILGQCQCALGKPGYDPRNSFGSIRPNGNMNIIMQKWERHVMTLGADR